MSPYTIVHEWNKMQLMHRLKVMLKFSNSPPHATKTYGDWCGYKAPATVEHDGRTFIWFSHYWTGVVRIEKIMELKEEFEI